MILPVGERLFCNAVPGARLIVQEARGRGWPARVAGGLHTLMYVQMERALRREFSARLAGEASEVELDPM